jgi:hypothetical protein
MFTQYFLTSADPSKMVRFLAWVALLNTGREASESDFKEVFGMDWKQWGDAMYAYVNGGQYMMSRIKAPAEIAKAPVKIEVAPAREMRDLFVLTRILHQDIPDSAASLDALLRRGLKTESLRELLFAACLARNRPASALAEAEKLMAANTQNPAIYERTARLVFDHEIGKVTIDSRLSAAAAKRIRERCEKALQLEPRYPDANDLLALCLALQPDVSAADADRIRHIYDVEHHFVSTNTSAGALAIARWRSGDPERAREIAEYVSGSPFADDSARAIAKALLSRLAHSSGR